MSGTPEFLAYDADRRAYVESIDTYDGSTEYTTDPMQARIFRGETWAEFWTSLGKTLMPAP